MFCYYLQDSKNFIPLGQPGTCAAFCPTLGPGLEATSLCQDRHASSHSQVPGMLLCRAPLALSPGSRGRAPLYRTKVCISPLCMGWAGHLFLTPRPFLKPLFT